MYRASQRYMCAQARPSAAEDKAARLRALPSERADLSFIRGFASASQRAANAAKKRSASQRSFAQVRPSTVVRARSEPQRAESVVSAPRRERSGALSAKRADPPALF